MRQKQSYNFLYSNKGFTLIELILVLLIIGLGTAFIVPSISSSLINLRLKAATRKLSTVLRYTRSKAVANKKTLQVLIDIDSASYSVQIPESGTSGKELVGSTAFPADIRFREVKIGREVLDSGQVQLLFYPKGNTSGGEIVLENKRGVVYKITIDPIIGKVKIIRRT